MKEQAWHEGTSSSHHKIQPRRHSLTPELGSISTPNKAKTHIPRRRPDALQHPYVESQPGASSDTLYYSGTTSSARNKQENKFSKEDGNGEMA